MAEYCEKCLVEVLKYAPKEAKKENRIYKKGEKDLCEGCGARVVMRNLEEKIIKKKGVKKATKKFFQLLVKLGDIIPRLGLLWSFLIILILLKLTGNDELAGWFVGPFLGVIVLVVLINK